MPIVEPPCDGRGKTCMARRYAIGPSIGIARVGNSPDSFYLAPDRINGLPIECDQHGNSLQKPTTKFKDAHGLVRRQAALFRIFAIEEDQPDREITVNDPEVKSISWTVHLANKKACWYNFSELEGNLLYGPKNSYEERRVERRNEGHKGSRRDLIIDPGPRTLDAPLKRIAFSKNTVPKGYMHASFPEKPTYGKRITTLGEMLTDKDGRLLVLGCFGYSGGDETITDFGGADSWYDDISDCPVYCTIEWKTGKKSTEFAWCIVGSPKFVPEIANVVTLDDTMYDVAVRHFNYAPRIYSKRKFNSRYIANFETDIRPILERPAPYRWVANVPSMNSLSPPPFNARDNSPATAKVRAAYFKLFRKPSPENKIDPASQTLFSPGSFPLMPLNSGSNSVSNDKNLIDKFLTLTETQYFLLNQWAKGKFSTADPSPQGTVTALSRASLGNCVGGPFCPGIEVTWSTRNQNIYKSAFAIRHRYLNENHYFENGLDPDEDETAKPKGCEPGDLTKRMAIPWQADFFQCSIEFVNFTDPTRNTYDDGDFAIPPTYYSYWWPPQSPWNVITGDFRPVDQAPEEQALAGTPSGLQVLYSRGINTFGQMISSWYYMGFIVNQARGEFAELFPYFTEQERNHKGFVASALAVGDASNVQTGMDSNFVNTWYLRPVEPKAKAERKPEMAPKTPLAAMGFTAKVKPLTGDGEPVERAIAFPTSRRHGRRPFDQRHARKNGQS